jgi:hypothetical protein
MHDQSQLEFERKARFDLWIHQNTLFWDRLKILALLQAAYFAAIASLKDDITITYIIAGGTLILMGWLYRRLTPTGD